MATVASKMTALADEVREISGATNKLSIDAMTEHVSNANDEINSQATTIAEIAALLNGKSVPGGGSSGGVETCTVTIDGFQDVYYVGVENGALVMKTNKGSSTSAVHSIVAAQNSILLCTNGNSSNYTLNNAIIIYNYGSSIVQAYSVYGENASIVHSNSGGSAD